MYHMSIVGLPKVPRDKKTEHMVLSTVWKFGKFSAAQILREITLLKNLVLKLPILAILKALNFIDLVNSSFQKMQKFIKIKIQNHYALIR